LRERNQHRQGPTTLEARRYLSNYGPWPAGFDCGADAAAGVVFAFDYGPHWVAGFHHIFENLVDDVFLEDAQVAVAEEIGIGTFMGILHR